MGGDLLSRGKFGKCRARTTRLLTEYESHLSVAPVHAAAVEGGHGPLPAGGPLMQSRGQAVLAQLSFRLAHWLRQARVDRGQASSREQGLLTSDQGGTAAPCT